MAMSRSYHLQNPQRWGRSYQAFQGGRLTWKALKNRFFDHPGVIRSLPGVPGLSVEGFGVITDYLMIEMGWVVPGPMAVTGIDQLCPAGRPGDVVTSQNHTIGYLWIPLVLKYGWKIFSSFVNDFLLLFFQRVTRKLPRYEQIYIYIYI